MSLVQSECQLPQILVQTMSSDSQKQKRITVPHLVSEIEKRSSCWIGTPNLITATGTTGSSSISNSNRSCTSSQWSSSSSTSSSNFNSDSDSTNANSTSNNKNYDSETDNDDDDDDDDDTQAQPQEQAPRRHRVVRLTASSQGSDSDSNRTSTSSNMSNESGYHSLMHALDQFYYSKDNESGEPQPIIKSPLSVSRDSHFDIYANVDQDTSDNESQFDNSNSNGDAHDLDLQNRRFSTGSNSDLSDSAFQAMMHNGAFGQSSSNNTSRPSLGPVMGMQLEQMEMGIYNQEQQGLLDGEGDRNMDLDAAGDDVLSVLNNTGKEKKQKEKPRFIPVVTVIVPIAVVLVLVLASSIALCTCFRPYLCGSGSSGQQQKKNVVSSDATPTVEEEDDNEKVDPVELPKFIQLEQEDIKDSEELLKVVSDDNMDKEQKVVQDRNLVDLDLKSHENKGASKKDEDDQILKDEIKEEQQQNNNKDGEEENKENDEFEEEVNLQQIQTLNQSQQNEQDNQNNEQQNQNNQNINSNSNSNEDQNDESDKLGLIMGSGNMQFGNQPVGGGLFNTSLQYMQHQQQKKSKQEQKTLTELDNLKQEADTWLGKVNDAISELEKLKKGEEEANHIQDVEITSREDEIQSYTELPEKVTTFIKDAESRKQNLQKQNAQNFTENEFEELEQQLKGLEERNDKLKQLLDNPEQNNGDDQPNQMEQDYITNDLTRQVDGTTEIEEYSFDHDEQNAIFKFFSNLMGKITGCCSSSRNYQQESDITNIIKNNAVDSNSNNLNTMDNKSTAQQELEHVEQN